MKRFFVSTIVVIALILGGSLLFVYSGIYNVSALHHDPAIVRWALHTTMLHSASARGKGIQPPADVSLNDPKEIERGLKHYDKMCIGCHGAPGIKPEDAHYGLNPTPPDLADAAEEMAPGTIFWIVKHGVKMTGMPAWGPTHSDEKLWAIVAFVKHLPKTTAADYKQMLRQGAKAEMNDQSGDGNTTGHDQTGGGHGQHNGNPA